MTSISPPLYFDTAAGPPGSAAVAGASHGPGMELSLCCIAAWFDYTPNDDPFARAGFVATLRQLS